MYYVKMYVQFYFIHPLGACSEKKIHTHSVDLKFPSEFSVSYVSVHNNLLIIFKLVAFRFLKSESNK